MYPWRRLWQFAAIAFVTTIDPVSAQSISACQPPQVGEYLVLVRSPTPESQEKIRRALPANTTSIVCRYLNETVTRTGTFTQPENANSQAEFINNTVGLAAFVVRSSGASPPPTSSIAFAPKPLGTGYAVLVDYFNRPETAVAVRSLLGVNIGLAAYGQRPYLVALHTPDATKATATLQRLSDRGFYAIVVDSRKVMLLTSKVAL